MKCPSLSKSGVSVEDSIHNNNKDETVYTLVSGRRGVSGKIH